MRRAPVQRDTELLLANVVREVLMGTVQVESIYAQAQAVGYSRAHWTRLFAKAVGEPPAAFLRRIQLERAGAMLTNSTVSAKEIGEACGYANPSAFGRAFRRQWRQTPAEYRRNPPPPPAKVGKIHWVPLWDEIDPADQTRLSRRFPMRFRFRPSVELAVMERFGSYSRVGEFLAEMIAGLPEVGREDRVYFTIYHDNIWTHPTSDGMRAHLGFALKPGEPLPDGFETLTLASGTYATFEDSVPRTDRNEAWAWMSRHRFAGPFAFDEYEGFPLPWEASRTRLWTQVR